MGIENESEAKEKAMVLLKYFNAGTLSTLSNVLACSRRSDRGDGATYFRRDVSRKKKKTARGWVLSLDRK